MQTGLVIKAISGFYTIQVESGDQFVCKLPGRLKRDRSQTDIVAVGDRATFNIGPDEELGIIESVAERKNVLSRTRPSAHNRQLKSDKEQVLVANVDQVIFTFALKKPATSLRKLDRLLVAAERQEIPAVICINKLDLGALEKAQAEFGLYADLGYPVVYTSTVDGIGIDEIRALLKDKLTVFAGSSGVGKSSLLNAIQPGLGLDVGEVSQATTKGMHTTRYAELFPLEIGGFVADTPGIRGWAIFDIAPEELEAYFREIEPLVQDCRYSDCTHRNEPGCAVRAAVEAKAISAGRYDSYLRLREEHEALFDQEYS
ncbi:MAG: ribosome small subunit-dependent GTPase A [Chloroflexota bacterium]